MFKFRKLVLAVSTSIAICTCHTLNAQTHTSQHHSTDKPNVIFILVDDMGYGELGSFGQKIIKTPNLDKMAQEGMKFTQFYAGSAVCAPSRASLMTGKHTGNSQIRGNYDLGGSFDDDKEYGQVTSVLNEMILPSNI